jgi:DNA-binding NarL/FixJ family response regulator
MFSRAATEWQALPRPYDALLAAARQGRCLLTAGANEHAVPMLSQAFRGLVELDATSAADRIAHQLRAHGVDARRDWRRGRRGYGDRLSPRELEVVRLVITGKTNRQIAQELCRSPKTVANQLKSAMRKLGVSSRTALAVSAIDGGVVSGRGPSVAG